MTQDTRPQAPVAPASSNSVLTLDLKEKEIVFVLPLESTCSGATLEMPGGALILGHFTGSLICAKGAIIIAKGATFSGYAEADEIFIAGEIGRTKVQKGISTMVGRLCVAVSEEAVVHGDLHSRMFDISNTKNITGNIRTLA